MARNILGARYPLGKGLLYILLPSQPMPTLSWKQKSKDFFYKGAILEVGLVPGQYVSSYFSVPNSKGTPDI